MCVLLIVCHFILLKKLHMFLSKQYFNIGIWVPGYMFFTFKPYNVFRVSLDVYIAL